MTTRLALYNGALRHCGERKLASLTENREPRRLLDTAWDGGAVNFVLEQGFWRFASRMKKIDSDPSVTVEFGHKNAFAKPDDLRRLCAISADEYFNTPLTAYSEEGEWWYADVDPVYIKYVSSDTEYGGDLSRWPENFSRYVEAHLAVEIIDRLSQNETKLDKLYKIERLLLTRARSSDAMSGPTQFPPTGAWVSARANNSPRRDGGNRGGLIG